MYPRSGYFLVINIYKTKISEIFKIFDINTNSFGVRWKDTVTVKILRTRKYPLRGYILGVLTHTTALDRVWGGDETLKCGIVIYPTCANDSSSHK